MRFNMQQFEAEPARESSVEYARPGGIVSGAAGIVKAAYEVRDRHDWKLLAAIYADGRAEGLPAGVTVNRIPRLIAEARAEALAPKLSPHPLAVTAYLRTPVPATKDDAGRIFVWDKATGAHREVVYK